MELFTTVDVIGQGLPLMMPKGTGPGMPGPYRAAARKRLLT